jgi:hypothetical protein
MQLQIPAFAGMTFWGGREQGSCGVFIVDLPLFGVPKSLQFSQVTFS